MEATNPTPTIGAQYTKIQLENIYGFSDDVTNLFIAFGSKGDAMIIQEAKNLHSIKSNKSEKREIWIGTNGDNSRNQTAAQSKLKKLNASSSRFPLYIQKCDAKSIKNKEFEFQGIFEITGKCNNPDHIDYAVNQRRPYGDKFIDIFYITKIDTISDSAIEEQTTEDAMPNQNIRGVGGNQKSHDNDNKRTYSDYEIDHNNLHNDIAALEAENQDNPTEKIRQILCRIGQGEFRQKLIAKYNGKCAITGIKSLSLLRASHIKPWRHSTPEERMDEENGILLIADIDAAFDRLMISFEDNGNIILSEECDEICCKMLGIDKKTSIELTNKAKEYMEFHRKEFYQKQSVAGNGF